MSGAVAVHPSAPAAEMFWRGGLHTGTNRKQTTNRRSRVRHRTSSAHIRATTLKRGLDSDPMVEIRVNNGIAYIPHDLAEVLRQEAAEIFTAEGVEIWMNHPNRMLKGVKPVDAVKSKTGFLQARAVLGGIRDGVFV